MAKKKKAAKKDAPPRRFRVLIVTFLTPQGKAGKAFYRRVENGNEDVVNAEKSAAHYRAENGIPERYPIKNTTFASTRYSAVTMTEDGFNELAESDGNAAFFNRGLE